MKFSGHVVIVVVMTSTLHVTQMGPLEPGETVSQPPAHNKDEGADRNGCGCRLDPGADIRKGGGGRTGEAKEQIRGSGGGGGGVRGEEGGEGGVGGQAMKTVLAQPALFKHEPRDSEQKRKAPPVRPSSSASCRKHGHAGGLGKRSSDTARPRPAGKGDGGGGGGSGGGGGEGGGGAVNGGVAALAKKMTVERVIQGERVLWGLARS